MTALIFLAVLVLASAVGITLDAIATGDGRHATDRFFAFLSAFIVSIATLIKQAVRHRRRRK